MRASVGGWVGVDETHFSAHLEKKKKRSESLRSLKISISGLDTTRVETRVRYDASIVDIAKPLEVKNQKSGAMQGDL